MSQKTRQTLLPVLAALIWGTAFAFQSMGAGVIGPMTFNAARSTIAAIVLFFTARVADGKKGIKRSGDERRQFAKKLAVGGLCCGLVFSAAANLQQFGMSGTSAGKAAFITTLYVVLVPIFGIFLKKKTAASVWVSVAIAVVGLYMLCINGDFQIAPSDLFVLACAFMFALHIIVIDKFVSETDGIWLSFAQFLTASVLCWILAFMFEHPTLSQLRDALWPILYLGIFSSGVAYTLQIIAQKDANPTVVSLLLSLESVFGTIAGALILGERLTPREYVGCLIMFIAVVLSQIPTDMLRKAE